jgi:hypothetical protein
LPPVQVNPIWVCLPKRYSRNLEAIPLFGLRSREWRADEFAATSCRGAY